MAEEYPTEYAKRLAELAIKKTKVEAKGASLDKQISQESAVVGKHEKELAELQKVLETHQEVLDAAKKEKADLEARAKQELVPEQAELREAALASVTNLFMYKAFCLDPSDVKEIYNSLISKYQMLKSFLEPNSWLIIEEHGVDITKSSNEKTSLENEVDYSFLAIGKTMEEPIKVARNLTEDGEVYMQIRLRFQPEGFVFRTFGAKTDGSGMGVRVDVVEKPDRPEFGKDEGLIYWHIFHPVLSRLEETERGISYEAASFKDPRKLDFYHGDEKLRKMGLDPSVKTVRELYEQINL